MGPLSLQGEYRQADFDAGDGGNASDMDVGGSYIQASYILTGESRGYKGKSGKFDKVKLNGPMGAWELLETLAAGIRSGLSGYRSGGFREKQYYGLPQPQCRTSRLVRPGI